MMEPFSPPRAARKGFSQENIVLSLLFTVTAINYLDRQALSVIAPILHKQISLTATGYSHIVFLFLLGYTIGQTIDGKVIDSIGTRRGMLICVALWSVVSMFHSLATGVISLGILRFLLGVTEAGNWPGGVKAVAENFPSEHRAFAVGIFNSGSTLGAIIAPPLIAGIVEVWGWRWMFVAIGMVSLVWVFMWIRHYQTQPAPVTLRGSFLGHPRSLVRTFIRDKSVWGLMISRFFADPIWWFYAFWLPEYLAESRGFSLTRIGQTAWIPFVFAGVGGWLGGFASDILVRRGWAPISARKAVMGFCACLMLCGIPAVHARGSVMALALISVVLLGYTGWASNILSLVPDLFGSDVAAQVTGLCGTTAAVGGMLFTLVTGWLIQNVSYGSVFFATAGMIICAFSAIVWLIPRNPAHAN